MTTFAKKHLKSLYDMGIDEDDNQLTGEHLTFEDFKNQNGMIFWWATDLMRMLGYTDLKVFRKVIDRATKAFISLGIDHYENIVPISRIIDSISSDDYKLTRFACYLVAMNSDPKKREVAAAQAYFASQTRKFEIIVQKSADIDRLLIRDEISDGNKSLANAAYKAGVEDYARFQNAGYLGMYNMLNVKLANKRGVDKDKLFDTMGRTELAANLFRITQTEERIKNRDIRGQKNLEQTHKEIGRAVREIVKNNTGRNPEDLPQTTELPMVKKNLKIDFKEMKKIDSPEKNKSAG